MTFDDDFARLNLSVGAQTVPIKALGLEWPPPEYLYLLPNGGGVREAGDADEKAFTMKRCSYSEITDEMRADMTHVCRGAEYRYLHDLEEVAAE